MRDFLLTLFLQVQVAPLEELGNDQWDALDVPRRKRSGKSLVIPVSFQFSFYHCTLELHFSHSLDFYLTADIPKRRPGTAWCDSSQLSGPLVRTLLWNF
jgi:hypothetical protein